MAPDNTALFEAVYMSVHRRYDEAIKSFQRSALPLPEEFIAHLEAMSQLCYGLALYYEGYMSEEQLEDFSQHGSGKAYYCITQLKVGVERGGHVQKIMQALSESRVPSVVQKVMPIVRSLQPMVQEQSKSVMGAWQLRVGEARVRDV